MPDAEAPPAVTWSMIERASPVLLVSVLSAAVGLLPNALYGQISRQSNPSERQAAEITRVLAAAGLRLLPDGPEAAAASPGAPTDAPRVVTAAALRRASTFLRTGALSRTLGKHPGTLSNRLRANKTDLNEAESASIVQSLASVGIEVVLNPAESKSIRARWAEATSRARLYAGGGSRWTPAEIRMLRARLGLTESEMAEAVGYRGTESVVALERGAKQPIGPTRRVLDYLDAYGPLKANSS